MGTRTPASFGLRIPVLNTETWASSDTSSDRIEADLAPASLPSGFHLRRT